jgi:hypothetical protein
MTSWSANVIRMVAVMMVSGEHRISRAVNGEMRTPQLDSFARILAVQGV